MIVGFKWGGGGLLERKTGWSVADKNRTEMNGLLSPLNSMMIVRAFYLFYDGHLTKVNMFIRIKFIVWLFNGRGNISHLLTEFVFEFIWSIEWAVAICSNRVLMADRVRSFRALEKTPTFNDRWTNYNITISFFELNCNVKEKEEKIKKKVDGDMPIKSIDWERAYGIVQRPLCGDTKATSWFWSTFNSSDALLTMRIINWRVLTFRPCY